MTESTSEAASHPTFVGATLSTPLLRLLILHNEAIESVRFKRRTDLRCLRGFGKGADVDLIECPHIAVDLLPDDRTARTDFRGVTLAQFKNHTFRFLAGTYCCNLQFMVRGTSTNRSRRCGHSATLPSRPVSGSRRWIARPSRHSGIRSNRRSRFRRRRRRLASAEYVRVETAHSVAAQLRQ